MGGGGGDGPKSRAGLAPVVYGLGRIRSDPLGVDFACLSQVRNPSTANAARAGGNPSTANAARAGGNPSTANAARAGEYDDCPMSADGPPGSCSVPESARSRSQKGGSAVSQPRPDPELARTVAYRPPEFPIEDRVLAEHATGFVEQTADDVAGQPGAVPPPAPTRPVPRESLAARLRARFEKG